MMIIPEKTDLESYLKADECVDFQHPAIARKAEELLAGCGDEETAVHIAFDFVCDAIPHSADICSHKVSRTASEVLLNGEGICYAKTMLLAALLRWYGIPVGFCYQLLRLDGTPDTGLAVHALNAVWLSSRQGWTRLDARGNTKGIAAKFIPGEEQLAFPVRPGYGESDDPVIYAAPHPVTVQTLNSYTDCREMFENLPDSLH
ncbi:MAG: transglutaminase family protein [Victivallaceae bacterium]|nr:transglutaminase-like domain-containing protein [Victivallaceae bacterium]